MRALGLLLSAGLLLGLLGLLAALAACPTPIEGEGDFCCFEGEFEGEGEGEVGEGEGEVEGDLAAAIVDVDVDDTGAAALTFAPLPDDTTPAISGAARIAVGTAPGEVTVASGTAAIVIAGALSPAPRVQALFFSSIGSLRSVVSGDIDGDGDDDLVGVGRGLAAALRVDGELHTFAGGAATGAAYDAAVLVDLDGDGDLDAFAVGADGTAIFANGDGGTFAPITVGGRIAVDDGVEVALNELAVLSGDAGDGFVIAAAGARAACNGSACDTAPLAIFHVDALTFRVEASALVAAPSHILGADDTGLLACDGDVVHLDASLGARAVVVAGACGEALVDVDGDGDAELVRGDEVLRVVDGAAGDPVAAAGGPALGRLSPFTKSDGSAALVGAFVR